MNENQFREQLSVLLNTASKTNDAGALISGLSAALASILAIVQMNSTLSDDDAIEMVRHQLDVGFTWYSEFYKNASNKAA